MAKVYIVYDAAGYGISKRFDRRSLYLITGSIAMYIGSIAMGIVMFTSIVLV